MKFISKYNQYIKKLDNFKFIINFDNITNKEMEDFFIETNKYFYVDNYYLKYYITEHLSLQFNCWESLGNANTPRISIKITIPRDANKSITIKEFLSVGYKGVKKYIKMKNNVEKYNL